MTSDIPKPMYNVEYLVGKFDKQGSTDPENIPFWVCFETKDLTKAKTFIEESQSKSVLDSRSLRILKKSTTVKYDVV